MDQSRRKEKEDLKEDSYKILSQFYKKILHRHNLVFFRQFCKIFYDY